MEATHFIEIWKGWVYHQTDPRPISELKFLNFTDNNECHTIAIFKIKLKR